MHSRKTFCWLIAYRLTLMHRNANVARLAIFSCSAASGFSRRLAELLAGDID